MFKNKKGFSDGVVMIIIGGILGSLFILGVFVWKEVELFNTLNQAKQINYNFRDNFDDKHKCSTAIDCVISGRDPEGFETCVNKEWNEAWNTNPKSKEYIWECISTEGLECGCISNKCERIDSKNSCGEVLTDIDIGDWLTYTNKELGFSIKYPKHYLLVTDDYGISLETIYEKPLNSEEMFMGGGASIKISFATDENSSGPYFTDSFIEENSSLQGFDYYTWVKNNFSEDMLEILAFYNKEIVTIDGNKFTAFDVASGMNMVREYFLFKDDILIHRSDNRLGASEQELNERIIATFKFI
jgi:hypothetical protein